MQASATYQPGTNVPGQAAPSPETPQQAPQAPPQVSPAVPVQQQRVSALKETVIYGTIGAAATILSIALAKKLIHDIIAGREERRSLDTESHANIAKRINMAFDNDGWWGTDEEKLRATLRQIPSQEDWVKIGESYKRMYGHELMERMESELTSSELSEMMAIIRVKPETAGGAVSQQKQVENWAQRLYDAFSVYYGFIPGTDEDAVKTVFMEIPSRAVFKQVEQSYQNQFGSALLDDLKGDMWDWADYMAIIDKKQ